jgi:hypothetical protein
MDMYFILFLFFNICFLQYRKVDGSVVVKGNGAGRKGVVKGVQEAINLPPQIHGRGYM